MPTLIVIILAILKIFEVLIILVAAMSWLIAFNIMNINNNIVRQIWLGMNRATEPVLAPIRRVLPSLGGIDLSPLVALLVILFVQQFLLNHS